MTEMEALCKLEEITTEELMKVAKKGEVAANEWPNLSHVVSVMKNVKKVQMMLPEWEEQNAGYSSRSYNTQFTPRMSYRGDRSYRGDGSYDNQNGTNSYERGRSRTTGRYMSRDSGRSMHSIKDRMVDALERMYDEAATEHEKIMVDEWIRKIESSER